MRSTALVVIALIGSSATGPESARTTYDAVRAGMSCTQNSVGDMECNYRVGQSLHFAIAGVGQEDASIYFYSASIDGDYFAVVGLAHGCVVVRPGKALGEARFGDVVLVSPGDGKIYSAAEGCFGR